jgi:hypothetical protein
VRKVGRHLKLERGRLGNAILHSVDHAFLHRTKVDQALQKDGQDADGLVSPLPSNASQCPKVVKRLVLRCYPRFEVQGSFEESEGIKPVNMLKSADSYLVIIFFIKKKLGQTAEA